MTLQDAIKANLPIIQARTDDRVYIEHLLQSIAGKDWKVSPVHGKLQPQVMHMNVLFYTWSADMMTADNYKILRDHERSLIVLNAPPNDLSFDVGHLQAPDSCLQWVVEHCGLPDKGRVQALRGLSMKVAEEVLLLTSAKYGDTAPKLIKEVRRAMGKAPTGLNEVSVEQAYYEPMPPLVSWVNTEKAYFLSESAPQELVPRGVLLYGHPGTGKTSAAKYIAGQMGVPLYHLDPASMLTKYIGESETRLAQSLALVEAASPCVLLVDEVEKVFVNDNGENSPVVVRMMSQLLWWLQNHKGRVITVMTTNNRSRIPPELYREGRIDLQLEAPMLTGEQANALYKQVLLSLLKPKDHKLTAAQAGSMKYFSDEPVFAHSQVVQRAKENIKKNQWVSV